MTKKQTAMESVEALNVIDDALFQKMAEDKEFCEEMISTILEQKITVLEVTQQDSIKNLQGRSVVIDALCLLEDHRICNVEVPDVISIFISVFDIFKSGKTVYHIDRIIRETGEVRTNGFTEIYVNTKIEDGSDTAELMRIFKEQGAYDFEKFPKTSARKQQFLKVEGGKEEMCEVVENYARQVAEDHAKNFFENGVSLEVVKKSITNLSEERLQEIYNQVMAEKE